MNSDSGGGAVLRRGVRQGLKNSSELSALIGRERCDLVGVRVGRIDNHRTEHAGDLNGRDVVDQRYVSKRTPIDRQEDKERVICRAENQSVLRRLKKDLCELLRVRSARSK